MATQVYKHSHLLARDTARIRDSAVYRTDFNPKYCSNISLPSENIFETRHEMERWSENVWLNPESRLFRNREEEEIERGRTIRFLAPLNYTDIINRSSRERENGSRSAQLDSANRVGLIIRSVWFGKFDEDQVGVTEERGSESRLRACLLSISEEDSHPQLRIFSDRGFDRDGDTRRVIAIWKREGKRKGAPIIDPLPLSSSSLFRVLHVDTKNHHHHSRIDVIRRFRVKVGGRSRPSPPCSTRARFNPRPLGVETLEISWPRREESRRETFPKNSFA